MRSLSLAIALVGLAAAPVAQAQPAPAPVPEEVPVGPPPAPLSPSDDDALPEPNDADPATAVQPPSTAPTQSPPAPAEPAPPPPPAPGPPPPVDLGGSPPPPPPYDYGGTPPPPPPWADSQLDAPPEPRVRNGFSAKLGAGPMYRSIHGHDIWGARFTAALGAQFKDIGSLHGEFGYAIGKTDGGLETETLTFAPTWEFIIERFRIGLGPQWTLLWMERVTIDESMFGGGWGFTGFASVDLIQGDHANMYLALDGRYSWFDDGLDYGGLGLSLGARFKTP